MILLKVSESNLKGRQVAWEAIFLKRGTVEGVGLSTEEVQRTGVRIICVLLDNTLDNTFSFNIQLLIKTEQTSSILG